MSQPRSGVALLAALPCAVLVAAGCASQILAPPARFQPLESPRLVPAHKTALELEGGGGGEVFAGDAYGGTIRLRRGLTDSLELSGEGSVAYIDVNDSQSDASRLWGAARVGLRGRFVADFPHAWWGVGLGGGAYAGGGFLSPDVALGLGWVNPYVIPYVQAGLHASIPIASRLVDTSHGDSSPTSDKGELTFGTRVGVGLEVPIADVLALDFGMSWVHSEEISGTHTDWVGLAGKVSVTF